MLSTGAQVFRKQNTCPSAETLLSFHKYDLAAEKQSRVTAHLADCDFCGAEFQLLSHHAPRGEARCALETMPPHLSRLAESLLGAETLHGTTQAKENLSLTDA